VVCAAGLLCCPAMPRQHPPAIEQPDQFEIGVLTYFDFGPPFDYYELFLVRPAPTGTSVQRIDLTPGGTECGAPLAKVETASGSLNDSVAALMGSTNLCAIPEKVLQRKPKRCRHCLNLSGANVVIQVRCGTTTRLIHTDVLEKYWFDAGARIPDLTSWTMELMKRLNQAVGPGVMEKPVFQVSEAPEPPPSPRDSAELRDVSDGKYDGLFPRGSLTASELYRSAQNRPTIPAVRLLSSSVPLPVETFTLPEYSPIARVARVEGRVSFQIEIDPNGGATNLTFGSGAPLLLPSVTKAVNQWRFPKEFSGQQIQITLEFALNCPSAATTGNR